MGKQIILSIQQREKGLINLIGDAYILGFDEELIKDYKRQLGQVQKMVKAHKEGLKRRLVGGLK